MLILCWSFLSCVVLVFNGGVVAMWLPGGLILAEPLPVGSAAAFFNSSSAALSPDTPWLAWAGKGAITGIQGAPGVPDDVSTVLWRDVVRPQLFDYALPSRHQTCFADNASICDGPLPLMTGTQSVKQAPRRKTTAHT